MCDYSLQCIKTRLATEGEQLFVHKFYTGSKGLASVRDWRSLQNPQPAPPGTSVWGRFQHWLSSTMKKLNRNVHRSLPAVCIPPGARLRLEEIPPRLQARYDVGASEHVIFAQLSLEAYQYRDAVRFRNGQEVLLQYLEEGMHVRVISLAPDDVKREVFVGDGDILEELGVVFSSTENREKALQGRFKAQVPQESYDF